MNVEISIDKMPSTFSSDNMSIEDIEYCHNVAKMLASERTQTQDDGIKLTSVVFSKLNECDDNDPLVKEYEKIPPGSYSHDGFVTDFKLSSKDTLWF